MNPFLSLLGGNLAGGNPIKQALIAMASGQSAEDFMANLSKNDARFQGLDFSNLEQTARNLCRQKGIDENQALQQVQNNVKSMM